MQVNSLAYKFNYKLAEELIVAPGEIVRNLAAILKSLLEGSDAGGELNTLLSDVSVNATHTDIANKLKNAESSSLLLGSLCESHPQFAAIRALASRIASHSGAKLGYAGGAANSGGAWLAGALPHRGPGAAALNQSGLNSAAMIEANLPAYLVYSVEPELDCWEARLAGQAMDSAECVIVFSSHVSEKMREYADVLLPLAVFAENEGSYINAEGLQQKFKVAVAANAEARPGWKILRVLANKLALDGYQYEDLAEVEAEMSALIGEIKADNQVNWSLPSSLSSATGKLQRMSDVSMNNADTFVRRARSLQMTIDAADGGVHINSDLAEKLGLTGQENVSAEQDDVTLSLPLVVDERVPDDCVLIQAKHPQSAELGAWFSDISLGKI